MLGCWVLVADPSLYHTQSHKSHHTFIMKITKNIKFMNGTSENSFENIENFGKN